MSNEFNSPCPLCQTPATFVQIDLRRKHFKCSSCTEYVLWRKAETLLAAKAWTTKERFAAKVREAIEPEFIHVISGPTPNSEPHVELQVRAQLRSEALAP